MDGSKPPKKRVYAKSKDDHRRFAKEVVKDPNYGRAAVAAGYTHRQTGYNLITNPEVRAMVAAEQERWLAKIDVKIADILEEIRCLAFSNVADLYWPDGRLRETNEMPEHVQRAIKSITVHRTGEGASVIKYELWDKPAALDRLGKHFGAFIEKLQVDHRHYHQAVGMGELPLEVQEEIVKALPLELRIKLLNWMRQQRLPAPVAEGDADGHLVVEASQNGDDQAGPLALPGRAEQEPPGDEAAASTC